MVKNIILYWLVINLVEIVENHQDIIILYNHLINRFLKFSLSIDHAIKIAQWIYFMKIFFCLCYLAYAFYIKSSDISHETNKPIASIDCFKI